VILPLEKRSSRLFFCHFAQMTLPPGNVVGCLADFAKIDTDQQKEPNRQNQKGYTGILI
jgi:hypothetical protein